MEILVVEDDAITSIVQRKMLQDLGHAVTVCPDGGQAWALFQEHAYPVVISDWMMPTLDGTDLCRNIRQLGGARGYTYFILATSRDEREDRLAAMEAGADDFLVKPFDIADLAARLRIAERIVGMQSQLQASHTELEARVEQRTLELKNAVKRLNQEINDRKRAEDEVRRAYAATIEGWSRALELRDKDTEGHTQRVTEITLSLARRAGFTDDQLYHVRHGALLHDIGKMGVPDEILLKPGPLTPQERLIVEKHPQFAYDLLAPIPFLKPALSIPYCHHERWDGEGYPRKLRAEKIPVDARLFAIADVWDALRADRPYRKSWPFEKVLNHIREESGSHFDPWGVEQFLKMVEDGELAQIEAQYSREVSTEPRLSLQTHKPESRAA